MSRADEHALAEIARREWPRVVATLVGDFGDLSEAEDAAQEATLEALRRWPQTGVPARPGAWLTTVARRRAIDRLRRRSRGREKADLEARLDARLRPENDPTAHMDDETMLRDEQLRLLFACCHPALSPEAQMALTLRSLGGLSTAEIARAFLVPEPTIAQRLVRAKKKIAGAGIPFRIPPDHELLARTEQVRTVVYLIFNGGYVQDTEGTSSEARCLEAIRLADLLAALTPDDAESLGLHALLLLIHSRIDARHDAAGDLVLLPDQDRSRWDRHLIARGVDVLDRAIRLERPGPLQIQAAIQALHCEAPDGDATDWEQIALLYRRLNEVQPTPVVRLNWAVAVAMAGDLNAGLEMLGDAEIDEELGQYAHFHSARADLLRRVGLMADAADAYARALDLAANEVEQTFLRRRLEEVRQNLG